MVIYPRSEMPTLVPEWPYGESTLGVPPGAFLKGGAAREALRMIEEERGTYPDFEPPATVSIYLRDLDALIWEEAMGPELAHFVHKMEQGREDYGWFSLPTIAGEGEEEREERAAEHILSFLGDVNINQCLLGHWALYAREEAVWGVRDRTIVPIGSCQKRAIRALFFGFRYGWEVQIGEPPDWDHRYWAVTEEKAYDMGLGREWDEYSSHWR